MATTWSPKTEPGHNNDSDKLLTQDDWARTEGDGVIIEGIDNDRLLIWLSGGGLPEGRTEPMSLDACTLYHLLATYYGGKDFNPFAEDHDR